MLHIIIMVVMEIKDLIVQWVYHNVWLEKIMKLI